MIARDPLARRHVVVDDRRALHARRGECHRDDDAGAVLARRAVHEHRAGTARDILQRADDRVGPVGEVAQVELRSRAISPLGAGDHHVGEPALLGIERAVADVHAPVATSGPGPSSSTSSPVRRSTTTRTPSVVDQPRDVGAGEALEVVGAQQHAEAVTPPSVNGRPPRSRTLAAPSRLNPGAQARPTRAGRPGSRPRRRRAGGSPSARSACAPTATAVPLSVCTCARLAALRPVADVEPARLEVGRVRGRGQLAVALLGRAARPRVVLLGAPSAEVVDRDVDHAVRDLRAPGGSPPRSPAAARARPPTSSGSTNENISTLSNWCTRKMPRVSLPAAPASRRKQGEKPGVAARQLDSRISPACSEASGDLATCRPGTAGRRPAGRSAARCRAGSRCRTAPPRAPAPAG